MFELLALFFTRHQRAEHAAKYNKYRKGYQTGRCKELTPQQQLVARRKRDVGYLTLLIVGALGAGAAFNSLSNYNPYRSTSSVSETICKHWHCFFYILRLKRIVRLWSLRKQQHFC